MGIIQKKKTENNLGASVELYLVNILRISRRNVQEDQQ